MTVRSLGAALVWTMRCPNAKCRQTMRKEDPKAPWHCNACGWTSAP